MTFVAIGHLGVKVKQIALGLAQSTLWGMWVPGMLTMKNAIQCTVKPV